MTPVACAGTLVGVLPDLTWQSVTVALNAGDTLLLHTDGATEARDANGRELGQQVLTSLLADAARRPLTRDVTVSIADGLQRRAAGLRDDLALLALSR